MVKLYQPSVSKRTIALVGIARIVIAAVHCQRGKNTKKSIVVSTKDERVVYA